MASFPLPLQPVPIVSPLSAEAECGWRTDRLSKSERLTWMYGQGGRGEGVEWMEWMGEWGLSYHPPAIPLSPHASWLSARGGEGERETRTESYLWHSDACLTLEEANHGIEVARMMGYRLSERGGEGGLL